MDRDKITQSVVAITAMLTARKFTGEETVALLKCLEHVFKCQAIEKDLVIASLKKIKAVAAGLAPVETLLPKSKNGT